MNMMSSLARGFNVSNWYWYYQLSQRSYGLIKMIFTALYMRKAANNGGYIGRETILHGCPKMPHGFHGVHISRRAEIGRNVTIYQNVTIGATKGDAPKIGENGLIGAGAIILGGCRIGNNVKIGAGAIVVGDIPDNCTVVSEKSKIIEK
jgi:serine O-acetyltransferase